MEPRLFKIRADDTAGRYSNKSYWATTVEAHDYDLMSQFSAYEDEHQCPVCQRSYWTPMGTPTICTSELTLAWPDFMETPLRTSAFFVSERVLDTLDRENITGYKAVQAEFKEIPPNVPPPGCNYFDLHFDTHFKLRNMRDPVKPWSCHYCDALHNSDSPIGFPDNVEWDSWDGTDFVVWGLRPGAGLRVSRRVVNLAHEHRWTGVRITPCFEGDDSRGPGPIIDHLGDKWPPNWNS